MIVLVADVVCCLCECLYFGEILWYLCGVALFAVFACLDLVLFLSISSVVFGLALCFLLIIGLRCFLFIVGLRCFPRYLLL